MKIRHIIERSFKKKKIYSKVSCTHYQYRYIVLLASWWCSCTRFAFFSSRLIDLKKVFYNWKGLVMKNCDLKLEQKTTDI